MHFLSTLKIRTRLLLLLTFSLIALLALGAFSALSIKIGADGATSFIDVEFASVRALSDVRAAVGNARRYEKDIFLNMGDEKETGRYTQLWAAELRKIRTAIVQARAVTQPADLEILNKMQTGVDNYDKGFKGILGKLERGELNDPWAANTAMTPLKEDIRQTDTALAALSDTVTSRATERRLDFMATAGRAPGIVLGVTAVVSILASLLAMAIVRSILRPIGELQGIANAWGQGDLSVDLEAGGTDELSGVKHDLSRMRQALVQLIDDVRSGVNIVGNNTDEIAMANSDLSERTEQAAASLQKTAASMAQLSFAVKHTADSATQAVQTSRTAMRVAVRGGEVVASVTRTMDEINSSSHKIADIISVIDGIAFQTNILALNAAVEAARAGEQGRGFAVVASEVRSLAGRSAAAAHEIKGIIETSVSKVGEGTALVEEAGRTMQDIVASVGQVSAVIEEIRLAANEQHEGIDLISVAMAGIDQATQQNAAMVEESAAGAMSLSDETRHLREAIAVFKLAESLQQKGYPALAG
jgi:methyl-accepting chemotaxis protein